mmetsp:Transcript_18788/g.27164  ORF Transcript_18788/g.27164 Transcript_18788/m.27164 type:complete len:205 (-) Transcript_18788:474-1088(-)
MQCLVIMAFMTVTSGGGGGYLLGPPVVPVVVGSHPGVAVAVVEQRQADNDRPEGEHRQVHHQLLRLALAQGVRQQLGGPQEDEDAHSEHQQKPQVLCLHVCHAQDHHRTQDSSHRGHQVEGQGPRYRHPSRQEHHHIRYLLRYLVGGHSGGDGPALGSAAPGEGRRHQHTVQEVVHEVPKEHVPAVGVQAGQGLPRGLQVPLTG